MKLLYLAPLPIDIHNLGGIQKKIFCQLSALSDMYQGELLYYFNDKIRLFDYVTKAELIIGHGKNRFDVLRAANALCVKNDYDAVYIRYPKCDVNFIKLCKTLREKHIKYVVEIPTYPYDQEGNETIKGRIINAIDKLLRVKMKKYVDRIVTYSDDRRIFGIETINTINGIDFDGITADTTKVDLQNDIRAIAVSAMYRVHGYDRFIEGLRQYYENGGTRRVTLLLVGAGDKYSEYQELVKKYNLFDHVVFLGTLLSDKLERAYSGCAIGVNSLAIHRQGLINESTLKTKEYAAKGLPIISSSYVDAFSKAGNSEYVMRIPPDESPVDIEALIKFVDKVYSADDVGCLRSAIREDGRKICDIRITMQPVIDYLVSK